MGCMAAHQPCPRLGCLPRFLQELGEPRVSMRPAGSAVRLTDSFPQNSEQGLSKRRHSLCSLETRACPGAPGQPPGHSLPPAPWPYFSPREEYTPWPGWAVRGGPAPLRSGCLPEASWAASCLLPGSLPSQPWGFWGQAGVVRSPDFSPVPSFQPPCGTGSSLEWLPRTAQHGHHTRLVLCPRAFGRR